MKKEFLIVDGYNIINAWPNLVDLKENDFEHAREKLIEILSNYTAYMGLKTILVFDAHHVKQGLEKREVCGGIEVIYTQEGVTADMVIERIVADIPRHRKVYVATSDRIQQEVILSRGALRKSAMELYREVNRIKKENKVHYQQREYNPSRLDERLSNDVREKLERMRLGLDE